MMPASSVPAATDYLVAEVRKLPAAAAPVVISDGWPTARSDQMLVIGVNPEGDESGATAAYDDLSGREREDVELPCIVIVRKAGDRAAKHARDRAHEMFDAVRALIRDDRRFGGAINQGLPARVVRWSMSQTADARQAGEGRVCEIRFVVAWQHRS